MSKIVRRCDIADEKELKIKYSLEDAEFKKRMSESTNAIQSASRQFKLYATDIENTTNSKGKLEAKAKTLNAQLTEQKEKVKLVADQLENVKNREGDTTAETQRLTKQLDNAQIAANKFETELSQVTKELALMKSEKIKEIGKNITETGDKITAFGKGLTTHVTLPLLAIGAAGIKAAIDVESAFAGVEKTVDAPRETLEALKQGFIAMSREVPIATTELMAIGEAAGQLGIQTPNILDFTRTMADLGVSTNMSSEQAATSLARLANITGMSQNDFGRLGSTIVALGNNFATTESEITEMGLRLAGAGEQIGLSEANTMSFATALSSVGINAEAGGSAFSKVMLEIDMASARGTESVEAFANIAGMSAEEFAQKWEAGGDSTALAFTSFIEGLGRIEQEGGNAAITLDELGFSEVRVRDALLRSAGAGDLLRNSISLGTKAWSDNNALTDEAAKRYETTESRLILFKNQLVEVGMKIGEALLPHLERLVNFASGLADGFMALDPGMQTFIVNAGLFVAAVGPALVIGGTLISSIGTITTAFGALTGVTALASIGTAGVGTAMGTTALAAGATTGGVGLFGTALSLLAPVAGPAALVVGGVGLALWGVHEATKQTTTEFSLMDTQLANSKVVLTDYSASVGAETTKVSEAYNNLASSAEPSLLKVEKSLTSQKEVLKDYGEAFDGVVQKQVTYDEMTGQVMESTSIKVDEAVLKQIDDFVQLGEEMTAETTLMWATSEVVTQEKADSIASKVNNMTTQVITAVEQQKNDNIASITQLKNAGIGLTDEQYTAMLNSTNQYAVDTVAKTQELQNKINAINKKATDEHRALTEQENKDILALQEEMNSQAVKSMSNNAIEQEVILGELASNKGKITKAMVQDTIKKMNESRDGSVKAAEETYKETLKNLLMQRDQTGEITDEQFEVLNKNAIAQKDAIVKNAEVSRIDGIEKLAKAHTKLVDGIDLETGKGKSFIQGLSDSWSGFDTETKVLKVRTELEDGAGILGAVGGISGLMSKSSPTFTAPASRAFSTFANALAAAPTIQRDGIQKSYISQARTTGQTINSSSLNKSVNLSGGITFNITGTSDTNKLKKEIIEALNSALGMEVA